MAERRRPTGRWVRKDERLFTLEVVLTEGPVTEEFAEQNPVVSRTIRIRGDQTLEALHYAVFNAFDREEEHMYEFQVGGQGPMDPEARRYVLPMAVSGPFADEEADGLVQITSVGAIGLEAGDVFGYWFDFGDDWWHQVNVLTVQEEAPPGDYPRVAERVGESPPQYLDWDDEE